MVRPGRPCHAHAVKIVLCLAAALVLASACHKDGTQSLSSSASAPAQLAFDDTRVGDHQSLALTVRNDSIAAIDLLNLDVAAPFSVAGASTTIPASGSATLMVVFAPQLGQAFDQPLTLHLDATDTPTLTVRLTGKGLASTPALCTAANCGAGHACCGDACVDTQGDPTHCGGCSTACAPGQSCSSGVCTTPTPPGCSAATCGAAGHACCGGACVETQTNPAHCGGCGACAPGQTCAGGVCSTPTATACDDLTAPCPGGQKCCGHACVAVGPSNLCPCTGPGGSTTFDPGTIIIPMDACYQRGADVTTLPSYCNANAKATADDSPLKAYGLVFFLLRHQVTVYMAINPAKPSIDAVDLTLDSFLIRSAPVQRYDWASAKAVPLNDLSIGSVQYRGGPFIIDASQHDRVLKLFATDPDFAQFRSAAKVTVHVAGKAFSTAVAKSISAVPSRVALLVPAGDSSPTDILVRYLDSAGLNFPGAGGTPGVPGLIYDQLKEADFLPDYAHSKLKSGGYKLLWSPHWEGGTASTPAQLATIAAHVAAGNDLFAECAAIGTLEGLAGDFGGGGGHPLGSDGTRFMTSKGMAGNALSVGNNGFTGPFVNSGLGSPFAQRGDFSFAGFRGAITDFQPDSSTGSAYYSDVVRYISASDFFGNPTDLFASVDLHAAGKGTVVYLAGHDYSYGGGNDGTPGVTAGSRLVLNTLFSLGTNNICQP